MINNFARRHARPSMWRILARLVGGLVIGIILLCFLGYIVLLILAMTVKVPIR